ncbi:MAG: hypothetical protein M3373_00215, partial [Gemmatimonadota bacterium]|nr:hypothetical protein [Gemmatimonadota bacterium]
VRAYVRAIELVPSFQRAFSATAYSRLPSLLYTETSNVRVGLAVAPDTLWFWAEPGLDQDTLVFVPYPRADVQEYRAPALSRTVVAAVDRNRELLHSLALGWADAFPLSADAYESLALTLESGGEISGDSDKRSALAATRQARRLAADPSQRFRLTAAEVRLRLKTEDFRGARDLADSVLEATPPTAEDARGLAALAALTGRARKSAALRRGAAPVDTVLAWDATPVLVPAALKEPALALLAYGSLGAPRDSIEALERDIARQVRSWVEPGQQLRIRDALLYVPMSFAFPTTGVRDVHRTRAGDYSLLRAQRDLAAGDTAAVRAVVAEWDAALRYSRPADYAIEFTYHAAWLLRAIGDSAGAAGRLDISLTAFPTLGRLLCHDVPQAAALVHALALRADLAAGAADRATAARWAGAVVTLWSDADPELQPIVKRMRALASNAAPRR